MTSVFAKSTQLGRVTGTFSASHLAHPRCQRCWGGRVHACRHSGLPSPSTLLPEGCLLGMEDEVFQRESWANVGEPTVQKWGPLETNFSQRGTGISGQMPQPAGFGVTILRAFRMLLCRVPSRREPHCPRQQPAQQHTVHSLFLFLHLTPSPRPHSCFLASPSK